MLHRCRHALQQTVGCSRHEQDMTGITLSRFKATSSLLLLAALLRRLMVSSRHSHNMALHHSRPVGKAAALQPTRAPKACSMLSRSACKYCQIEVDNVPLRHSWPDAHQHAWLVDLVLKSACGWAMEACMQLQSTLSWRALQGCCCNLQVSQYGSHSQPQASGGFSAHQGASAYGAFLLLCLLFV